MIAPAPPREGRERRPSRRSIATLGIAAVALLGIGAIWTLARPAVVCACSPTLPPPPASPVDGVVVAVDAAGLNDVRGFDLRTSDGRTLHFEVGRLENPTEFPPGHLAEHQATSSPVRVHFHEQDGGRVAYRLEDAPQ